MEISSVSAASAAPEQLAIVFVALELSKARWLVGIHTPVADKISRTALPTATAKHCWT